MTIPEDQPTRKGKKGVRRGPSKESRPCDNPACRQEFKPLNHKQRFCSAPACREMQNEESKKRRRQWWRDYRAGLPSRKEVMQGHAIKHRRCFLCNKPLRNGERINHIACIESRSYRRIDGDYLYV